MNFNGDTSAPRCGIILAGGQGKRLQSFIHRIRGDALPKQYVNFIGRRSMLEHTFSRAERLIHPEHIFTVVSKDHLSYAEVRRQLSARKNHTVIIQPERKETAPGLLLPLAHLYNHYPDATVVVFPSDHFIVEEELFMAHVDLACRVVERYRDRLVLLGMQPREPETDYGYIVPADELNHLQPLAVRPVLRFREKPDPDDARELLATGALWNTMVMVFNANSFIELVRRQSPRLHRFFQQIRKAIGTRSEREAVAKTYRSIEPVNFSTGLLEALALNHASRLLVLPVRGVTWSDWGSEKRLVSALNNSAIRADLMDVRAGSMDWNEKSTTWLPPQQVNSSIAWPKA
ncbi:MAG TPA: sugar phosphate nucleotidyltransferase [Candidatus Binatia bacterium]|jgi:mannose-1-phosphate guanylyltransferase